MTASIVRIVSVALTGALLCACGGGAGTIPAQHRGTSKLTQATFTIKWTNPTATAAVRRKDTISPAAQSIAVAINSTSNTIANRSSGATQSIVLDAPVGNDTFAFKVYDQPNAQGHLLGSAAVTQQIIDGAANIVNAAIQAVCSATNVGYPGNGFTALPTLSAPSRAQTLTSIMITGVFPVSLIVAPEDVDGDVIIAGTGGAINYTITGSATVTPIDGAHLSLTPLSGARTTTPDTLTVSAPGCPSTTVSVMHSPTIYGQTGTLVDTYDWFSDTLSYGNVAPNDVLIGYDTQSQKLIAYNASSGAVTAYAIDLSSSTPLYAITPGSTVAWSNYLHSVFAARKTADLAHTQLYTYASGVMQNLGSPLAGLTTVVSAGTMSYDNTAFSVTGSVIYSFSLSPPFSQTGAYSPANPVNWIAQNSYLGILYAFNASGPYVSSWYTPVGHSPTTSNFGFDGIPSIGAVDTDASDVYAVAAGVFEGSAYNGTRLNFNYNYYFGAANALIVVSSNER